MATRYVLLVGGDSFDYLDHLGLGAISFVPSLYRDMGPVVHFAPSDASYADVDGDGLQDLAIGRLPARTPQDLDAMIAKTLQYGSSAYGPVGVAAADYTDPSANESFATASDRIIDRFSANWSFGRVYMDQLALNDARERFFAGVADGSALTDYVGHSGLYSWGSPTKSMSLHLFTVKDVASLGNTGKPTVVVQLGCWNTLFSYPKLDTLGLRLVLEPDRGAAAVMGPATLTEDRNGNRFGALLIPTLSEPGMRIGDAIWQAKKSFAAQSPKNADVRDILLGWTLLGDPALQVKP